MHIAEQPDLLTVREMKRSWITKVLPYAKEAAQRLGRFTSDDIRDEVLSARVVGLFGAPEHNNWIGALCACVVDSLKAKEIERVRSKRREANGRKIGLYAVTP